MPGQRRSFNDGTVPNLQQLITEQKSLSGRSYADYEARAGSVISRQRWQQLGKGDRIKEFSEPATIQAMADALEVDATVVILAMAKTLGFPVDDYESDLARMLPPSARNLTVEQRDAIVRLVRAIAPSEGAQDAPLSDPTAAAGAPSEAGEDQEAAGGSKQSDFGLAARDVGYQSEGRRLRERQDRDAEHPDE